MRRPPSCTWSAKATRSNAEVELGDMTTTHQLIKSGLKPGEKIVSQGTHKIMPGDEIIPAAPEKQN